MARTHRRQRSTSAPRRTTFRPALETLETRLAPATVINTLDSGPGSLRQAILDANARAGADRIEFNIPGSGVQTIAPTSELPEIHGPTVIDGYTQPGAKENTLTVGSDAVLLIELSGANAPRGSLGLNLGGFGGSSGSIVRGLVINRFDSGTAIAITGGFHGFGSNYIIEGNFLGTDASGTVALPNAYGVHSNNSFSSLVGGTTPAARNVISGNTHVGVLFGGGGRPPGSGGRIQGNYIGTNAAGTAALGNGTGLFHNTDDFTIGGTAAGAGNLISGNIGPGIHLGNNNVGARNTDIYANLIGLDAAGTGPLGNGGHGIDVDTAPNTRIGGAGAGMENRIAYNGGIGVLVRQIGGAVIVGNPIHDNGQLGIDLGGNGVTPNDPGDADSGLQNFPVLTSVTTSGGNTTVRGTLNSTPFASFLIQLFTSAEPDTSGHGEGKRYLGELVVTTDNNGDVRDAADRLGFERTFAEILQVTQAITATATRLVDHDHNPSTPLVPVETSEFGPAFVRPVLQFAGPTFFFRENAGLATVTITRSGNTVPVDVDLTITGGTATSGADYTPPADLRVRFADGETSKAVVFPLVDDALSEGNETITLALANPSGSGAVRGQTLTTIVIEDNEPPPPPRLQFSAATYNVAENAGSVTITVTRSGSTSGTVTADFSTTDGTATAGADYTAASGTLTFADGQTSKQFTVFVLTDSLVEGEESVALNLRNLTGGAVLGPPESAVLKIQDSTPAPTGGSISGLTFHDRNSNGVQDTGEPGLNGWTIELVDRGTGDVVATQVTANLGGIDGSYRFDGLAKDQYLVREVVQPGWLLTAPQGNFGFADPVTFAVGEFPTSTVAADLDGDGDQDLAVTNVGPDTISVLLNAGNGSFGARSDFPVGASARSVTAADLDGDGDLDLTVTKAGSDTVSVLLNAGNGSFGPWSDFTAGNEPSALTAADLDGDGDLDLAVANLGSHSVSVLLNAGNGSFGAPTDFAVGRFPRAVTAADLDGDGDLDLAVGNDFFNAVSVLLNAGNGSFGPRTDFDVGSAQYSVTAADLDGDGDLDLAMARPGSDTISVLLNAGNGSFGARTDLAVGDRPVSVAAADLDGDGDLDLSAPIAGAHTVSVFLNAGNGSFGPRRDFAAGDEPRSSATPSDLDGDGDLDLVVANLEADTVSVLLNQRRSPHVVDLEPLEVVTGLNFGNVERLQIVSAPQPVVTVAGQAFVDIPLRYTTSDVDFTLPGLALRMHYDSSQLDVPSVFSILGRHHIDSQFLTDSFNLDGDLKTDRYVLLAWSDVAGTWPGPNLPLLLFTARVRMKPSATVGTTSTIRFTAASTAATHGFRGDPITVEVVPVNLDIDANGTADALTDGLLIRRFLGGVRGAGLVQNAVAVNATRTTPAAIRTYLGQLRGGGAVGGFLSVLDVDVSGESTAAHDGELIQRYLFGFRGLDLVEAGFDPGATRTNHTEITAYLDQLNPGLASVSGTVFLDTDGDRVHDAGETALAGQVIFADMNNSGTRQDGEPFFSTRSDGTYHLGLPAGSYVVRAEIGSNTVVTLPTGGPYNLTVAGGQRVTNKDFGLRTTLGNPLPGGGLVIPPGMNVGGVGGVPGSVTNRGGLGPGQSPGALTIDGDYTQTETGSLTIELAGLTPGEHYDQLHVTGAAALDGTLTVALVDGFTPRLGDRFQVLTYGSRTGAFQTLTGLDLGNRLILAPVYSADGLTLVARYPDTVAVVSPVASGPGQPGSASLVPLAGDWDGDGSHTLARYDAPTGQFFVPGEGESGAPAHLSFTFGGSGWIPLAGDWDGDGKDTIGVFDPRTATFYLRNANDNDGPPDHIIPFGGSS
jgi:hypothetical protein